MAKYVCSICGFVYDESKGLPEAGIAPGTGWDELPEDWVCPVCGAAKSEFVRQGEAAPAAARTGDRSAQADPDALELSPLQVSALCSNLARGCEKQYKADEAAQFRTLAAYFRAASAPAESADLGQLLDLIDGDLNEGFAQANAEASGAGDRGALRALVWSEKVTRILKSLLARYRRDGDAMFERTSVYVCTICGFIYVGDAPPEICPVCKVPNWKFEKIEGRQ